MKKHNLETAEEVLITEEKIINSDVLHTLKTSGLKN